MKKFLRITGIVVLLLIIALVALPFAFKGRIVDEVKQAANDNLNAQFDFTDLSLSLFSNFPQLTVDIEGISLLGIDNFQDIPLFTADEVSLTVDVMSLFGDTIAVREISLDKPYIQILFLEDGSANYDIAKSSEEVDSMDVSTDSSGSFAMKVRNYSVSNGTFIYDDATFPMRLEMLDTDHYGSGDFEEMIFTLSTQTSSTSVTMDYDGIRYINAAGADLQADLGIDLDAFKFTFMDNELKLNELNLKANGWLAMPEDDIDMDLTFSTPGTDFKALLSMVPAEFAKDLSQVDVSGSMGLSGYVKGTYNETTLPGFGVDMKVENGRFKYPDLAESVENIQLDLHVDAPKGIDDPTAVIELKRCHAEIAKNPIDAFLNVKFLGQDPMIDATLKAKIILETLAQVVPLEAGDELRGSINADVALNGKMSAIEKEDYANFKADGQIIVQDLFFKSEAVAFDMNINVAYLNFSPSHIELSNFKSKIGRSDISATGKFDNYLAYALKDEMLSGVFNLRSELLDLNEFTSDTEATTAQTGTEEGAMGVIQVPSNIDFTLNANIDRLIYDDIDMANAKGNIILQDRVAAFKDLSLDLLGGNVKVNGDYDTSGDVPEMDVDFNIKDMDINQAANSFYTIEKMAPIAKSCNGKFSTNLSLKASLDQNMSPIEETINGKGRVKTNSVNVEKFEPLNKLASELGIEKLAKQRFENLDIGYKMANGKIIVDPFVVKLDGVPATVAGSMTMLRQELDYSLKMDLPVAKLPGNIGSKTAGVLGQLNEKFGTNISTATTIPVSLKIGGTIDKPTVAGNYGELVKEQSKELKDQVKEEVKEIITEKVDEAKAEAIAKAKEQAAKMISTAQAQSDKLVSEATKQAEDLRSKGYAEAQKVEDSAKNVLEKAAKRALADKARKETDKQADGIIAKANEQAAAIMSKAQKDADALIQKAENQ